MMNRIDRDFVDILNVLTLLREHPLSYDELWESRFFKTRGQLDFALRRLKEGCCVEKIHSAKIYVLLGHGITLLSFYPTWRLLPFEVLDVVEPLGRMKELYEKGRSS